MSAVTVSNPFRPERLGFPTPHLERVMALHRLDAKTLGFLPKGAFEEHAKLRQIIIALDPGGSCIGYLLYRVARARASIVHLCVAAAARGKGVARLLVDNLKHETKLLEGIGLYCRRDYDSTYLWSKLGFEAIHAKSGRGKDLAELTFWWFSHGHKDLFSQIAEPDLVRQRVVIDANVFYDLHTRETPDSEDSKALLADWVQASIELVVTKELRNEIANGANEKQRRLSRAAATRYTTLTADDAMFQRLCTELRPRF
jgi:GNAT superfamily N-acetyltransferase